MDFKTQTKISIFASINSGVVAIGLAYLGFGVWSLVLRTLIQQFFIALLLSLSNRWKPSFAFNLESFKKLFSFGSRLLVSGLIDTVYRNIYYPIIGRFFNATRLGYFTNAKRLSDVASQAVTMALRRVTYPVLSTLQDDETRLRAGFRKIIRTTVFVNFPIMILLAATANAFIPLLLGNKWIPSVPYFQILCFAGILYPLHAINLNILQVKGRSDLFLKLEIIKKAIFTVLIITVLVLNFGIIGLIWMLVLNSFIALAINMRYSKMMISYAIKEQLKDISASFILSLIMGGIVYFVGLSLPFGNLLTLIIQIGIGFSTFFGLSKLFRIKELKTLEDLVTTLLNRYRNRK